MILFFEEDPNVAAVVYARMPIKDRNRTIWARTTEEAISTLKRYNTKLDKIYLDYPRNKPIYTKNPISAIEIAEFLRRSNLDLSKCEIHIITWSYLVYNTIRDKLMKKQCMVFHTPFGAGI